MFKVDADPGDVDLDADRLRRLDDVFRSLTWSETASKAREAANA